MPPTCATPWPASARSRSRTSSHGSTARLRLLNAAKRFKIVPVGFIAGQLRSEREPQPAATTLPSGFVTMLMTDIEGSTSIVQHARRRATAS